MTLKKYIKKKLKPFITKLVASTDVYGELKLLEAQVGKLSRDVHTIYPEHIILDDEVKNHVKDLQKKHSISDKLNLNIHKNDVMFQYPMQVGSYKDYSKVYLAYFNMGHILWNTFKQMCIQQFGSLDKVNNILDFASGYGRLTRYMVLEIPSEKIWVSDIKSNAIEFSKKEFHVNGFTSTYEPEELTIPQKFDIIYVVSLFSHLPDSTFGPWLEKLYNSLSDDGILAISVHDEAMLENKLSKEYQYHELSEEKFFNYLDDNIQSSNTYGTMIINEAYLQRKFKKLGIENGNYARFKKQIGNHQDLYIISKQKSKFKENFTFKNTFK